MWLAVLNPYTICCKAAEYKAGSEAENPATSSRNIRRAPNANFTDPSRGVHIMLSVAHFIIFGALHS